VGSPVTLNRVRESIMRIPNAIHGRLKGMGVGFSRRIGRIAEGGGPLGM